MRIHRVRTIDVNTAHSLHLADDHADSVLFTVVLDEFLETVLLSVGQGAQFHPEVGEVEAAVK